MKLGPINISRVTESRPAPSFAIKSFKGSEEITERLKIKEEKALVATPGFNRVQGEQPEGLDTMLGVYLSDTQVKGAIDKTVDFATQSGYRLIIEDEAAHEFWEQWDDEINFNLYRRMNLRSSLIYGTSFTEPVWEGGVIKRLKPLDSRTMRIYFDEYMRVEKYSQDLSGGRKQFFTTDELCHFSPDPMPGSAWGVSLIRPLMASKKNNLEETKLNMIRDLGIMMRRKATAPLHVKIGDIATNVLPSDAEIQDVLADLQYMDSRTEFATGPYHDMKMLDFGGREMDFAKYIGVMENQITYGIRVPQVLQGLGSIPEGLASVQMQDFMNSIKAKHAAEEAFFEKYFFVPMFRNLGFKERPQYEALLPDEEEKQKQIALYQTLLSIGVQITPETRLAIENKLRALLEIEGEATEPLAPPAPAASPFQPSALPQEGHYYSLNESIAEEWSVLSAVLSFLQSYDFAQVTDFSEDNKDRLRSIISDGIKDRQSVYQIGKTISDRLLGGDISRGLAIARTEVVRAENEGSLLRYAQSPFVEKVEFLTAEDERVDDSCMSLDGRVFTLEQANGVIPVHPNCRCTWLPILTEDKAIGIVEAGDCDASGGSWTTINGAHVCVGGDYGSSQGFVRGYQQANKLPNDELDKMLKAVNAKAQASDVKGSLKDSIARISQRGLSADSHANKVIALDNLAGQFHQNPEAGAKILGGSKDELFTKLNDLRTGQGKKLESVRR